MKARSDSPTVRPSDALLIGVDAGASHCTVVLGRGDLTVLGRADGPAGAMSPGGAAASAAAIAETARRAAAPAGLRLPADRAVIGAAGAGRPREQAELAAAVTQAGVAAAVRVLPDGAVALAAAFDREPGIVVNAGTGSVAFARDATGQVHRAGGHGWQLGDEGGGYWLGRRALDAAARTAVADAACELVELVRALQRHFPGREPIPIATMGGLMVPGSPIGGAFRDALAAALPRARIVPTRADPALGALRLAATED